MYIGLIKVQMQMCIPPATSQPAPTPRDHLLIIIREELILLTGTVAWSWYFRLARVTTYYPIVLYG